MGDTTPDDCEPTSDHEVMDANPQNHTLPDDHGPTTELMDANPQNHTLPDNHEQTTEVIDAALNEVGKMDAYQQNLTSPH